MSNTSPRNPVALNALRHGLTARTVILPEADVAAFQAHCASFQDEFRPRTQSEKRIVQSMAEIQWRLDRIAAVEINLFALAGRQGENDAVTDDAQVQYELRGAALLRDNSHSLIHVSLYEHRLRRQYRELARDLYRLQWQQKYRDRERHRRSAAEERPAEIAHATKELSLFLKKQKSLEKEPPTVIWENNGGLPHGPVTAEKEIPTRKPKAKDRKDRLAVVPGVGKQSAGDRSVNRAGDEQSNRAEQPPQPPHNNELERQPFAPLSQTDFLVHEYLDRMDALLESSPMEKQRRARNDGKTRLPRTGT